MAYEKIRWKILTRLLETVEEIIPFVASWIVENDYYESSFGNDMMT